MIEAMKQWLKALEKMDAVLRKAWDDRVLSASAISYADINANQDAITSLRQAIAEAEKQEPVAWAQPDELHISLWKDDYHTIPLYTTPPQRTWVGLSRENCYQVRERESDAFMYGVAWAEAKLKEKNT